MEKIIFEEEYMIDKLKGVLQKVKKYKHCYTKNDNDIFLYSIKLTIREETFYDWKIRKNKNWKGTFNEE